AKAWLLGAAKPTSSAAMALDVRKPIPLPPRRKSLIANEITPRRRRIQDHGGKNRHAIDNSLMPKIGQAQRLVGRNPETGGAHGFLLSASTALASRKQSTPTGMPQ